MKKYSFLFLSLILLMAACTDEETISEKERTETYFSEELGCQIHNQQMWKTAVKVQVNVTTSSPTKLWLVSNPEEGILYDYCETLTSGTVELTAPQGQVDTLYLCAVSKHNLLTKKITLNSRLVETVNFNVIESDAKPKDLFAKSAYHPSPSIVTASGKDAPKSYPASLCGSSVEGNGTHYQLMSDELTSFYNMMETLHLDEQHVDDSSIVTNYELVSNGPFYITWANGWEMSQHSHILGYYYHSHGTYNDIVYVDLSETHKWDIVDNLSKVQYQLNLLDTVCGIWFYPNRWYDANFDMNDYYGSTVSRNMDRIGDSAFCMKSVYDRYGSHISALRGLSFLVDVPVGKHMGFYLRADDEPYPKQWDRLKKYGVSPYTANRADYKGICFSAKILNVDGVHRSAIWDGGAAMWLGMEDYVVGGDNDCDDVVFCITADMDIYIPEVITPDIDIISLYDSVMPWTLAYEDPYRNADFDFNDAVIQLKPNFRDKTCCVTLMAVGTDERMYLCYDGPNGVENLGELHELFGYSNIKPINTGVSMVSTTPVQLDCVSWPNGYTMEKDAKRFYIEVRRGTCTDCTDTLSLSPDPGMMPEAVLVAGEWKWPIEGSPITTVYPIFSNWSNDPTRMQSWKWYLQPVSSNYVSY